MAPLLSITGLSKIYTRGKERLEVLKNVNLTVEEGEFLALMGPSGSGKTTLLNLIGGLDKPTTGRIEVGGEVISALGQRQLTRWRARHVGFIFQFYNLLPVLSAARNVEVPLYLTKLSGAERRRRVAVALELVDLSDRASHKPAELSGGQQQRVAIARALVSDPNLLVCDEPTGDLDQDSSDSILDLLYSLNHDHGKTIIMVTHDPRAAERATKQIHLNKGLLGHKLEANS